MGKLEFHAIVRSERLWRKSGAKYTQPRQQFTNTSPSVSNGVVTVTSLSCNTYTGQMTHNGIPYTRVPELVGVVLKGPGARKTTVAGTINAAIGNPGITFTVQARANAQFDVADISGRALVSRKLEAGEVWQSETRALPAGLYIARLRSGGMRPVVKSVLIER